MMFMAVGADHLGCPTIVTLLPPPVPLQNTYRTSCFYNRRSHRSSIYCKSCNSPASLQQHARPLLQPRQHLRRRAEPVSAAASSVHSNFSPDGETNQSSSGNLFWARSVWASISRQYQAAIASTKLQAAAIYNPKFLPMVTL